MIANNSKINKQKKYINRQLLMGHTQKCLFLVQKIFEEIFETRDFKHLFEIIQSPIQSILLWVCLFVCF